MDPFEAHNITFLDLSGVDEQERQEVLDSLYAENANVQLPWRVSEHKVVQKTDVKNRFVATAAAHHHQDKAAVVASHPQVYLTNQVDYNAYMPPPDPSLYHHHPYSQYVVYSTYLPPVVTTTIPITYTQTAPNANYITDDEYNHQAYVPPPVAAPEEKKEEPDANCNITTNGETTPGRANKSWASLFSNSKNSGVINGNGVNEKSSSNEAVNKQNVDNNNDEDPIRNPRKAKFIDPNCYRMGEFLLNYTIDGRTISLQPRGLINKSNYCYINSILQALLACPPVYNLLVGLSEQNTTAQKEKATPIIDGMCRFVKEFQHLPAGLRVNRRNDKNQKKEQGLMIDYDLPFEPSWIYKMLNGVRSDLFLVEGRQEDAEEFLGCLLNGLNDEMLELMKLVKSDLTINKFESKTSDQDTDKEWQVMGPKNKGSITRQMEFVKTPISNIFGGFLKSRIHRTGDHSTYNIQPFFTLQLNIEKVKTVREALEALVTKNQLEGVTNEKTNEEVEAWQQVTLEELPVILILHLKCFDFKLDGCTKIVKALEFPIDLKIDSKLLSSKPMSPKEKQYKLFAVVYHDGKEATKGHYITDAFHVGYSSWIRYDDASVKSVQEDYVLKPQGTRVPYLLFYRRSDTIRSK
ncbi:ubiquitin-specific protease [Tribolium castaneum]|uniref:ubiquitinyl hydrolase 1 n=1 Tax=Tribolium castaneum TaxID=7070 RepID=D6WDD8_TRICA|nr:PREDICTED: ubiquitin carboxyl-terminal hydrolase 10 [Tribolium castaneum]EFA01234.1 ubiquitin-specific protease [Tribolium castaneum]|eukprot:XP_972197.1 PREDICTED: ubiquitin carboxyl-terminal hydrolase 10 [Tribolium castaneum]